MAKGGLFLRTGENEKHSDSEPRRIEICTIYTSEGNDAPYVFTRQRVIDFHRCLERVLCISAMNSLGSFENESAYTHITFLYMACSL